MVARAGAVQGVVVLVGDHRGFSSQDIAGYEKVQHSTVIYILFNITIYYLHLFTY